MVELDAMAEDALRLLDHLKIEKADVLGYSMGARIAAFLAMQHPERVRSVVFSGMGERLITGGRNATAIAEALMADSPDDVTDANARGFRTFADRTGSDRKALAACIVSAGPKVVPEALAELSMPVMVAVGSEDDVAGPPEPLAGGEECPVRC